MLWFNDKKNAPWKYLAKNSKLALGCSNASTLQECNMTINDTIVCWKQTSTYILLDALLCSIADYFYKLCRILAISKVSNFISTQVVEAD